MSRQKKELMVVSEERDNHQLDKELLTNRLRHLEGEIEASKNSYNEKTREIRILEVDYQHLVPGDHHPLSVAAGLHVVELDVDISLTLTHDIQVCRCFMTTLKSSKIHYIICFYA